MRSLSAVAPARRRLRADLSMKSPATIKAMPSTWIVRRMCPPSRSARWPAGAGSSPARWWHSRGGRHLSATVQRRARSVHASTRRASRAGTTLPPATPDRLWRWTCTTQDGVGFYHYQATQRAGRRWSTAERLPAAGHRPGQPDGGDRRPGHRGADRGRAGRRGRYLRDGAERVARAGRQVLPAPTRLPGRPGRPPRDRGPGRRSCTPPGPAGGCAAGSGWLHRACRPSARRAASSPPATLRRIRGPHDHAHDPHPGQLPRDSQPTGGRTPARRTAGRPCGPGPGSATRSS